MSYVSHQLIVVSSLDRSVPFYQEYCALELLYAHNRPGQRVAWLGHRSRGSRLILVEGASLEPPIGPYGHVGVSCMTRDEYLALLAKAQARNLLERGPLTQPWPIAEWFSVLDPDGHRLEISFGQDNWPEVISPEEAEK